MTQNAASRRESSSRSMPDSLTTSGQLRNPSTTASGEASAPGPSRAVLMIAPSQSTCLSDSSSASSSTSTPVSSCGEIVPAVSRSRSSRHRRELDRSSWPRPVGPSRADGRLLAAGCARWLRLLSAGLPAAAALDTRATRYAAPRPRRDRPDPTPRSIDRRTQR